MRIGIAAPLLCRLSQKPMIFLFLLLHFTALP
jgi:hypothetical protein